MKKLFYILFATVLLGSCKSPNYTVSGHYELLPGDSVFLYTGENTMLASGIIAPDSTFTLRGYTPTSDIVTLTDRDRLRMPVTFLLESGSITIEPGPYEGYQVTGTPLNDSIRVLNDRLLALHDRYMQLPFDASAEEVEALCERIAELPRRMMHANLGNLLGLYLLANYEFDSKITNNIERAELRQLMANFPADIQEHPLMQALLQKLNCFENAQPGSKFTELVLPDTQGQTIALSSRIAPGRWVLLNFWATWCSPCCREIPCMRKVYDAYKDKGFEIYGVSLDNDIERWRKAVNEQDMNWPNVRSSGSDAQHDAATRYSITGIPANFLISPEGIIVAKNLRGKELERKLAEIIQ